MLEDEDDSWHEEDETVSLDELSKMLGDDLDDEDMDDFQLDDFGELDFNDTGRFDD